MKPILESKLLYRKYITDDLILLGLELKIEFQAGQFFQLIIDKDNAGDKIKGFRPYSIMSSPAEVQSTGIIETFVKLVPGGLASEFLKHLKEKDMVLLRGPFGRFLLDKNSKNHVFLATGTGITPMYSMIKEHLIQGNDMTLFYSAKTSEELAFHKEFLSIAHNHKNFHYYPTLTREESCDWEGLKGRINVHLDIIDWKNKTFYICGLKDFISDMRQSLTEKGVPAEKIIFERYD